MYTQRSDTCAVRGMHHQIQFDFSNELYIVPRKVLKQIELKKELSVNVTKQIDERNLCLMKNNFQTLKRYDRI